MGVSDAANADRPITSIMSICQDNAGFLFKHRCDSVAVGQCCQCLKPVCLRHLRLVEGQSYCTACAVGRGATNDGTENQDDDPYTYGSDHYDGYGHYGAGYWGHEHYRSSHRHSRTHDGDDFTEGDAEALIEEGDEGFESDMGAS